MGQAIATPSLQGVVEDHGQDENEQYLDDADVPDMDRKMSVALLTGMPKHMHGHVQLRSMEFNTHALLGPDVQLMSHEQFVKHVADQPRLRKEATRKVREEIRDMMEEPTPNMDDIMSRIRIRCVVSATLCVTNAILYSLLRMICAPAP